MLLQGILVCAALSFNAWQSHALKTKPLTNALLERAPAGGFFFLAEKWGHKETKEQPKSMVSSRGVHMGLGSWYEDADWSAAVFACRCFDQVTCCVSARPACFPLKQCLFTYRNGAPPNGMYTPGKKAAESLLKEWHVHFLLGFSPMPGL